jgi:hypothetical protein
MGAKSNMKKIKVTIRQRPLTGKNKGKSTIYLDFYPPLVNPETGKSIRREFLDMWIFDNPTSKFEKEHKRFTKQITIFNANN